MSNLNVGDDYPSPVGDSINSSHDHSPIPLDKTDEIAKNRFNLKNAFSEAIHSIFKPVIKLFRGEYQITEFFLKLFKKLSVNHSSVNSEEILLRKKQEKAAENLGINNFEGWF